MTAIVYILWPSIGVSLETDTQLFCLRPFCTISETPNTLIHTDTCLSFIH